MRRRAAEYRRPVQRRISYWIWLLLGLFSVAGLVLFVVQHNHQQDRIEQSIPDINENPKEEPNKVLNQTEIQTAASYVRQLGEQMTLAKAYVLIAKEHNNLQLAWELSSNIMRCQLFLSKAAMKEEPISLDEAQSIIKIFSSLIFKAQDIYYDIATTIMTMKSHIEALEERSNTAVVQSTGFGQMAVEALPKSLHCLYIKLTVNWLKKPIPPKACK